MLSVKRILCPIDFSEPSLKQLDNALEVARHFEAELKVLHVLPLLASYPTDGFMVTIDLYPPDAERRQAALQEIEKLLAQRVLDEVRVQKEVRIGSASHEIICAANDDKLDLIVIATHGRTGWRHLVFGSVAEAVVRGANCPVLTIHIGPDPETLTLDDTARQEALAAA